MPAPRPLRSGIPSSRTHTLLTYASVLGPLLALAAVMAVLLVISINTLSSARAYVGGESLWSKARAEAVQHLRNYTASRDGADYLRFEQALAVPLGDRQAREAMLLPEPDEEQARAGFLAGGNHPDDIAGMIRLFRYFGDQFLFKEPLRIWTHGDALIAELRTLARRIQACMDTPTNPSATCTAEQSATQRNELEALNRELAATEKAFSAALAESSHVTRHILLGGTLAVTAVLTVLALGITRRAVQRQEAHRRALTEANERWELAAEATGLGRFVFDVGHQTVHLDGRAATMFGLGNESCTVPQATMRQRLHPDDLAEVEQGLQAAIDRQSGFQSRYRVRLPDGSQRHVEGTGLLEMRRPGDVMRMVGVLRDVSRIVERDQLAAQRDAAEQVARARMEFLSRLSHELRTPLNAILGFSQLMELDQNEPLAREQAQRVALIRDAGRQLLALVEDVLDLTKIDARELEVTPQTIEAGSILRASAVLLDGARLRYGVTLINRLSGPPLWALADPQRLQQVCINLLTNACKYNRPGGEVRLEGAREHDEVLLHISDTGPGMSEEELSQLFQPFKRLAHTAGQVEGTGLGLVIVKLLMERMGGRVEVRSRLGEGTRFTLRLPAAR